MPRSIRVAGVISLVWSEMLFGGTAMLCLARWQSATFSASRNAPDSGALLALGAAALLAGVFSLLLHWRLLMGRRLACGALALVLVTSWGWLACRGVADLGLAGAVLAAMATIPSGVLGVLLSRSTRFLSAGF
jgi:hypothetical protein